MQIPIQLNNVITKLNNEKFIQELRKHVNIYLVGGSVRDAFLKKPAKDIDIVVEGLSLIEIKDLICSFGKLSIVGESFAVLKFKPSGWSEDIDIAVPREDKKIGIGHKGIAVSFNKNLTIYDDLKRRDITINSIAIDLSKKIIDPFDGIGDINNKLIKATSYESYSEDPLRILRTIGFASRFKFNIEPHTLELMRKNSNLIKEISGERIRGEFDKIIYKHGSTKIAFDLIERSDIDKALFGEKFFKDGFEYFDDLDLVSFYYVLGNLGHKDPAKFYRDRLKGEAPIVKALMTLEKYFSKFDESKSEKENKWNVFVMLKEAPLLTNIEIMPKIASDIIDDMKAHKIPMKLGDIPVNGNDIMERFPIGHGEELGGIINFMYQEALMNKFNWKDKEETLKYLETI